MLRSFRSDQTTPETSSTRARTVQPATSSRSRAFAAVALVLAALLALAITGCTSSDESSDSARSVGGEQTTSALFIGSDGKTMLLVDTQNQTPFTTAFPEDGVIGIDGSTIGVDDLMPGNIVNVVGDGIMLESYPGQYPGVTSITVINEGSRDDVAEYEDLLISVFSPVDDTSVPAGFFEYESDYGRTTIALEAYKYDWYGSNAETSNALTLNGSFADDSGILDNIVNSALLTGSVEGTLSFDRNFQSMELERTPVTASDEPGADGANAMRVDLKATQSPVPFEVTDNGVSTFKVEPGYLYNITVKFAHGEASYAFYTIQ